MYKLITTFILSLLFVSGWHCGNTGEISGIDLINGNSDLQPNSSNLTCQTGDHDMDQDEVIDHSLECYEGGGVKKRTNYYTASSSPGNKIKKEELFYDENGNLATKVKYESDGVTKTDDLSYHENGNLSLWITYFADASVSREITYYASGNLKTQITHYANDGNSTTVTKHEFIFYENNFIKVTTTYFGGSDTPSSRYCFDDASQSETCTIEKHGFAPL